MRSFSVSFPVDFPVDANPSQAQTTLIADLTEGIVKGLTFLRVSANGWYRDTTGTWVNIGAVDTPRFHHDPSGNPIGLLIEGLRTNYMDTPAVPANQTIDLTAIGTGDYILSMEGTGDITVAAGTATGTGFGAATEGSPVIFNLSVAGTVTLTVTGSPDRANVQKGASTTTFILNAAAGTVRQPESCTFPIDGLLPENDFTIHVETTIGSLAQSLRLFGAQVDAGNYLEVRTTGSASTITGFTLRRVAATVQTEATITGLTVAYDDKIKVACRMSSVDGLDIFVDGVKGTGNASTAGVTWGSTTMYMGAGRDGTAWLNSPIENFRIIVDPARMTDARLIELTT